MELTHPVVSACYTLANSALSPDHCWGQHSTSLALHPLYCPLLWIGTCLTLQQNMGVAWLNRECSTICLLQILIIWLAKKCIFVMEPKWSLLYSGPIQHQLNRVHISSAGTLCFNIILLFTSMSPKQSLPFGCINQNFVCIFHFPLASYSHHLPHPSWFDHSNTTRKSTNYEAP
jgi:hypothetical protein